MKMDDIIYRINNIDTILDSMDDKTKTIFGNIISNQITKINGIIDEIEDKLSSIRLSEEQQKKINLDIHRNKLIHKFLFQNYWELNYLLQCCNEDELSTFEKRNYIR